MSIRVSLLSSDLKMSEENKTYSKSNFTFDTKMDPRRRVIAQFAEKLSAAVAS